MRPARPRPAGPPGASRPGGGTGTAAGSGLGGAHRPTPERGRVLYGEGGFVPNRPGHGKPEEYPWHLVLDAVQEQVGRP